MRFAVGYQLPDEDERPLTEVVGRFRERIEEVYFPWLDMPSGRSAMGSGGGGPIRAGEITSEPQRCHPDPEQREGEGPWHAVGRRRGKRPRRPQPPKVPPLPLRYAQGQGRDDTLGDAQRQLESDLRAIKAMGLRLDLLFNANCYGGESLSQALAGRVCSVIEHVQEIAGLDVVTTTSLFVARTVKQHFPALDVRASVNMRIGTVRGMEYVADFFDSFTIQREYNRDLGRISELRAWADAHGKTLHFLANSGCMSFCSGQTFHDNLVAHEAEICQAANVPGWNPSVCWSYYADPEHWVSLLQNSWVRPEDIHHYEGIFPVAKLATRMHANPERVIEAYCTGRYRGNLLDLFEPGHGPLIAPYVIDNERFPEDWFQRTTACDKRCEGCGYCGEVLREVLVRYDV